MQIGDLVTHKDYPRSIGIIVKTYGTPTGDRVHPPTIQVRWWQEYFLVDTLGSVWLRRIECS